MTLRLHLDGGTMPVTADHDDTALAPAPSHASAPSRTPVAFGVTPHTLEDAWRFAQMLANSDLVPKDYRGKPENCMVAMQYGAEVGLPPMASLQSIAVINGKPGLYGDGFLAVILATPAYAGHQEVYLVAGEERERLQPVDLTKDDTAALVRFWRKGQREPVTATFSIADARKAGLLGKDGPWTQYPARMLKMRARAFAGRDAFAAELRGMSLAEELRDSPDVERPPIAAPVRRSLAGAEPLPDPLPPPPVDADTPDDKQPADDKQPPPPAATTTTTQVVIEDTLVVVEGPVDGPRRHYEIKTMEVGGDERLPPKTHVFLTSDEALYKLAASCEGSGVLMVATWHRGKRKDKSIGKMLDSLAAAD
jgi:hypothetical protein